MRICASTICWHRDPLPVALRKARAAGFDAVEVLTFPREIFDLHGDLREMTARSLRDALQAESLTLAGLHLGAIQTRTEDRRGALTDYSKRAIEVAAELACPNVIEGGPDRGTEPFEPFLDSLAELAPRAEAAGVRLCLENHYGNSLQFAEDYEPVFRQLASPAIGMTLDTGHFTSAGVDPEVVARLFRDRVYHVHVKDHVGTQSVALGAGETNNAGLARYLASTGYDGYLSQELEIADAARADEAAADGIAYMRHLADG
jgi:sugar phosphate isomerase/epimerase